MPSTTLYSRMHFNCDVQGVNLIYVSRYFKPPLTRNNAPTIEKPLNQTAFEQPLYTRYSLKT